MKNYDLVIIGGGTAGCAAAYSAGKLGLKVLLLEKKVHLGGAITSGLVVPVMNIGKNRINTDFYNDLVSELSKIGGQVTYQGNSGWFNPELTKIVLDKMLTDVGVEILFNANIDNVKINKSTITEITFNKYILSIHNETIYTDNNFGDTQEMLSTPIGARYFLDATGDCEFSKKINCEFLADNTEFQPMSLRFIMSGVDIERFADWILDFDMDREVTTAQKAEGQVHFSTAYTWDTGKSWALAPLFDNAVAKGELKDTDRNYFQIFTVAGAPTSVAFNCPRIVKNLNPNSIYDRSTALIDARSAILRLAQFCKKHFIGFENAYISNIADDLGVRVSNRIKGRYIYTIDDLRSGKRFDNPVLISNYPVDVHSSAQNSSTLETNGEYQLPIESLISADYDNLFVAGRCLSADYLSQGALRVQANCFAMGEAVAKYIYKLSL